MLYEQYFIDDLRDRADLVRIIEPYAQLKKKGANWMGCCPFHQEKTPSFSVSPANSEAGSAKAACAATIAAAIVIFANVLIWTV